MMVEKRALQALVALGSLIPVAAGVAGMIEGPAMLRGVGAAVAPDLASHFRYLSGLLCGLGIGFASCVPAIERKGRRLRLLGGIVIVGGLGRALGLAMIGWPGLEHRLALAMELGVTPLLLLWQGRLERRLRAGIRR